MVLYRPQYTQTAALAVAMVSYSLEEEEAVQMKQQKKNQDGQSPVSAAGAAA